MNISKKLLLGVSVLALAACSNEEPLVGGDDQSQTVIKPSGDVAYLNVRLQSADSNSRADYEDGEGNVHGDYYYGNENDVANAYFYFYDEDGKFVLESNTWLGADPGTADHIEMEGKTTIVLTGLTGKSYPSWVVTVLNRPENDANGNPFTPGATLKEMGEILLDSYLSGKNFVMTTSSFLGGVNASTTGDYTYFATKLKPTDFKEEGKTYTEEDGMTSVDIYVERLAARVGVSLALDPKVNPKHDKTFKFNGKDYNLYGLNVSVAGSDNPNIGGSITAATKVYVAIIGWELNSTAKKTNLMKDLGDWTAESAIGGAAGWWNKPADHRSFWGKSYTYGKKGTELSDSKTGALKTNEFAWNQLTLAVSEGRFIGDRAYCNETTNIPANLIASGATDVTTENISPKYTPSVVLSAVVCDENGKALTLVKYQGVEYTEEGFLKRILSIANTKKFYIHVEGSADYAQVDVKDVELVSASVDTKQLGSVKVALKDNNITYYKIKDGATKTDGKYEPEDLEEVSADVINEHYAQYTDAAHLAIAKTDGAMFYTIPLTHLNKGTGNNVVEGQYGVVRNHIYDLSITKIKSLGEGVFDPENEHIDPEEPKNPTFYVESAINILSWKIVSQSVEI